MSKSSIRWIGCIALLSITLGCQTLRGGMMRLGWVNRYDVLVADLPTTDDEVLSTVRLSQSYWSQHPFYQAQQTLVRKYIRQKMRSAIRLEIGNANEESYTGIWFIENSKGIWICSTPKTSNNTASCRSAPSSQYRALWNRLEEMGAWTLPSDISRVHAVLDGAMYFFSFYRDGQSHQFVSYAPMLASREDNRVSQMIDLIEQLR